MMVARAADNELDYDEDSEDSNVDDEEEVQ